MSDPFAHITGQAPDHSDGPRPSQDFGQKTSSSGLADAHGDACPPPYRLAPCALGPSPFLFAVPHSGRFYPPDMTEQARLEGTDLRQSEDAFVDQLFEKIPQMGGDLLVATHARAYVDLNRDRRELEPSLFTPRLTESDVIPSRRADVGLGVIPRMVAEDYPIYQGRLPQSVIEKRLSSVWDPYHAKVRELLAEKRRTFGIAIMIDCHSMPSGNAKNGWLRKPWPEMVIGDNWSRAARPVITTRLEGLLRRERYSVRRNVPYSGGFATSHYGQPAEGIHVLQLEIARAIYMDERLIKPRRRFKTVRDSLEKIFTAFIDAVPQFRALEGNSEDLPKAAE